eukprot:CAMPEP_0196775588 /NCGR_PEP_ID=MMETSP1104-20130614/4116_1 /TAXON_ID=33652 /ORGANISM="Cafeteria sp., Strain Caron Lab Isolate" /LENGTH=297 /DNA_ID=CAMNT_0042145757 /DNA_START=53 /DNA_END=942 /DNA_ORIENTATION=+
MTWIQSRGRLIVEAGWRSPQQRRQFLLHLAMLGLASALTAVLRVVVVEEPYDIDDAYDVLTTVMWRFALLFYSVSGHALVGFCRWTFFTDDPPRPSPFTSIAVLAVVVYSGQLLGAQAWLTKGWAVAALSPAYGLVGVMALWTNTRLKRRGLVPLTVGGWLYLVVAIFTQPVSDSLLDSLAGLPSSFSPTAAYNTGLLIVELLVVAGAQWAIRHGLVNDELSAELLVPKAAGGAGPRAVGGDEEAGLLSDGGASTAGAAPPVQTATTVLAAIRNRARASATPPSEGGSGLAAAEAPA